MISWNTVLFYYIKWTLNCDNLIKTLLHCQWMYLLLPRQVSFLTREVTFTVGGIFKGGQFWLIWLHHFVYNCLWDDKKKSKFISETRMYNFRNWQQPMVHWNQSMVKTIAEYTPKITGVFINIQCGLVSKGKHFPRLIISKITLDVRQTVAKS